ncbi:MAG: DUF1080 domain-containing protein [Planctomycetes bacterium]|nr:DUF1080 domain-containing protein [Planctomycetota bacterium]
MFLAAVALAVAQSSTPASTAPAARPRYPERLSAWETRVGWRLLFDGVDARAWGANAITARVDDGWLVPPKDATIEWSGTLGDFELELLHRDEAANAQAHAATDPLAIRAGKASGTRLRVVARGHHVEVWDGTLHFDPLAVQANSRVRLGPVTVWTVAATQRWRLALTASNSAAAFRSLRARELDALPPAKALFDGKTLAGWRALGDARWTVEDGCIVGAVGGGRQSFLVTEKEYGDFVLDVDLLNELPGNSGIQVRSHQDGKGTVFGYQIEIDPSARAWSGGLYDEGRRAWLADLSKDPLARAAFTPGKWNHYRIECVGPHIRTWVNGTPCVDALDPLDATGFLGLQVHSGNDTKLRWKNFELRELGASPWAPLALVVTPTEGGGVPFVTNSTGRWRVADGVDDVVLRLIWAKVPTCDYWLLVRRTLAPLRGLDWADIIGAASDDGWSFEFQTGAAGRDANSPLPNPWYAVFAGSRVQITPPTGERSTTGDLRAPSTGPLELRGTPGAPGPEGELHLDARLPH